MLCLSLVGGAERLDGVKLEFVIHPSQVRCSIGRDPACDWALPDRTLALSARHCEIVRGASGWLLRDLSTNGTFVNGSANRMPADHPLRDGDRFDAGPFTLSVRWNPAAVMPADPLSASSKGDVPPRSKSVEDTDTHWTPPVGGRGRDPAAAAAALLPPEPEEDLGMTRIRLAPSRPATAPRATEGGSGPVPMPVVTPVRTPMPMPTPVAGSPSMEAPKAVPMAPPALPQASPPGDAVAQAPGASSELARRMASGLGLPLQALDGRDPLEVAEQLGHVARAAVEALRRLMDEQSQAQRALGSRRPTSAANASPLRLAGNTDEALVALLSGRAPTAFALACADLVEHQARLVGAYRVAIESLGTQLDPATLAALLPGADAAQQAALYAALWQRLGVTGGDAPWAAGFAQAAAQHLASACDGMAPRTG